MRRMLRVLGSRWVLIPFFTLVLTVLFWLYSPWIGGQTHPFDAVLPRVIVVVILWLFAILALLLIMVMRGRRDRDMAHEIAESAAEADPADEAVKAELGDLRDKLRESLTRLRKTRRGRKHLYELPWYVIIGPPGAGKTTAIVNSGLQFPLADVLGRPARSAASAAPGTATGGSPTTPC